ncbi:O-methyltransferase [Lederbergia ruris]|uniref:tRNA 5-hydroxyuridine methyltransferase n=1 Tax=Lederbergia ruris TaxID=217495 RepID=A0ABQ4KD94_9BACI|nr:O-methyltransferase [Lederbergia ruris]GIN55867.1 SAM-dependent methyltransferase [Lederbergia ruris]
MIDESVRNYLHSLIGDRPSIFYEMEQYAKEEHVPIMESTGIEVMLQMMKIQKPKRILEIGTAIGYSALRMAEALPDSQIVTIEIDESKIEKAQHYIQQAGAEKRISIIHGNALDVLETVRSFAPFDAIFIDAAKGQYKKFFEMYSKFLPASGCIYVDNVLFRGLVADPTARDNKRLAKIAEKLAGFNQWLMSHNEFETVIIPVGDGLAVSRKV